MSKDDHQTAGILNHLREKLLHTPSSSAWLPLGDAISDLEQAAPRAPDGSRWTEFICSFHESLGLGTLSIGHIQKIRRVRNFVRHYMSAGSGAATDRSICSAQFSALEVAERLHTLDPERGQVALTACVRGGQTFSDLKRQYAAYAAENPQRLPRKQATWLRNRVLAGSGSEESRIEKVILSDPALFLECTTGIIRPIRPAELPPLVKETRFSFRITSNATDRTLGVGVVSDTVIASRGPGDLLARMDFQSSFFDHYWAFVTAGGGAEETLSAGLDQMEIGKVGVLRLLQDDWRVVRRPLRGLSSPDRRHFLRRNPAVSEDTPSP